MSRPLICDGCDSVIESPITPIKVVLNGPLPEELVGMTTEEVTAVTNMARQLGATSPIQQEYLDFCATLCLALWAWRRATGMPLSDRNISEALEQQYDA